mmetsp:Transcript_19394/g.40905  ORF Transcript_19394/g.40905 Transcript_19394/m.40905 type:complete len:338 (+) Transcript_19394:65-1078(+)
MSGLGHLLSKLNIEGGRREDNDFSEQLKATEFSIFRPIADFGYFSWEASGTYKSLSSIKTANEILHHIDLDGTPNRLKSIRHIETPKRFESPKSTAYKSKFPYSEIDIACIHVAVKRGVKLDEVDFCFGGSTLEMLAKKDANEPFIVSRIPGSKCILVAKKKDYTQDLADVGFQFERYVTGGSMLDTSGNPKNTEHIHTMRIGDKTVLFRAEVDASDADGSAIEIKASNPRYWGTKVMFQMISSGSSKLCHGEKSRGVLTRVTLKSLSSVSQEALEYGNISSLQKNIVKGMDAIQDQLKDGGTYRVCFTNGCLKLIPASTRVFGLFPPDHVVKALVD